MLRRGRWNVDTLKEHYDALRVADQRALQIKEEADSRALELAREIQTYKDEKANELRSQIEREQGERATKKELQDLGEKLEQLIAGVRDQIIASRSRGEGIVSVGRMIVASIASVGVILTLVVLIANHQI